jgi:V-type H+-transporting ATPase subunit C
VLKGHHEAGAFVDEVFVPGKYVDYLPLLKNAFREKKYILREFSYDLSGKKGGVDAQVEAAASELKQVRAATLRWCKANFGEVFSGWVHLKVIRAFVESVLRYGLPVDFLSCFVVPEIKDEKQMRKAITNSVLALCPQLRLKVSLSAEDVVLFSI